MKQKTKEHSSKEYKDRNNPYPLCKYQSSSSIIGSNSLTYVIILYSEQPLASLNIRYDMPVLPYFLVPSLRSMAKDSQTFDTFQSPS